jgi:transposase
MLPLRPGQIERRTHDYKRNGTTNLYAAFDILTGQVIGRTTKRHRAKEFLDFLRQINKSVPKEVDLHVILDNSSTHKTAEVNKWLKANPRFTFHFTPTSASWLNAVESWFGQLERRSIYRGVFTSVKDLRGEIHRVIRQHNNRSARPFTWIKSASVIFEKVDRRSKLKDDTNQTKH